VAYIIFIFKKKKKKIDALKRAKAQDAPRRKLINRLKRGEDNRIVNALMLPLSVQSPLKQPLLNIHKSKS
jgi:hypothetical protein